MEMSQETKRRIILKYNHDCNIKIQKNIHAKVVMVSKWSLNRNSTVARTLRRNPSPETLRYLSWENHLSLL